MVIGIGEFTVTTSPDAEIVTHALGSCVAVCLWDPVTHVAGMLHFLLPEAKLNPERAARQPATFADYRHPVAVSGGVSRRRGEVAAARALCSAAPRSPAARADSTSAGATGSIAKKLLWQNGVLVKGEALGGTDSRTVSLSAADGRVVVTRGREVVEEL